MKAVYLLLVCLLGLVFANDESLDRTEKATELVRAEAMMLHKMGEARANQNALLRSIFDSENKRRQSAFCDSDSDSRDLEECDDCTLLGAYKNVTVVTEDIGLGETDGGDVDLVITLGVEFSEDFSYDIASEVQIQVDERAALVLNLGQEAICETDYDDIDWRDDLVRTRVIIDGSFDSRFECLIDSCDFTCRVAETFSQTICGNPITAESFAEFIGDLVSELGVDFDSEFVLGGIEDSNFLTELFEFGSGNPCDEIEMESDYPSVFGVNFGGDSDSDDNDCNVLFFDVLPEVGLIRQSAGGRLIVGLGMVVVSLVVSLFGGF